MTKGILVTSGLVAVYPAAALASGGGEGGGSWLSLLFFAINFGLFAFGLVYFAAPMVRKFFADRAGEIRGTLARADSAYQEAQDRADKAAARLAGLDAEKAGMERELNDETAYQVRRIGELAKEGAQRIRRDAELSASAAAEDARRRLRLRLAGAAAGMARELITRDFEPVDQRRLLEAFLGKLSQEAQA